MLLLRAMLGPMILLHLGTMFMSIASEINEGHVDICGLRYHLKP